MISRKLRFSISALDDFLGNGGITENRKRDTFRVGVEEFRFKLWACAFEIALFVKIKY